MRVSIVSAVNFSDRKGCVSLDDNSSSSTQKAHTQRERVDIEKDQVLQGMMLDPLEKSSLDGGPASHGLVRVDVGVVTTLREAVPQQRPDLVRW